MVQEPGSVRRLMVLAAVVLVLLVIAVFFPVLGFEFVSFDVAEQVTDNTYIRGLTGENVKHILTTRCITSYYPVRTLTFAIDYQIWGLDPRGFKLTNVLIHLTNVILVFGLAMRLFRDPRLPGRSDESWDVCAAAVSAGIFAVHPVVVEPVAWVSGREELLMTMGALGCFIFHFTARRLEEAEHRNRTVLVCHVGAAVACAAACLSNAVAAVIPLFITIWDVLTLRRPKFWRIAWSTSALWVVGFVTFVIKKLYDGPTTANVPQTLSREWLLSVLNMFWLNLKTLVWPTDLCIYYAWPNPQGFLDLEVILGVMTFVLACLALWTLRQRHRVLFGLLWFGLALVPSSHIFFTHHIARADRFFYLPLVGLALALGVGLRPLKNRLAKPVLRAMTGSGALVVLLLATISVRQIQTWENGISLFTHALDVNESDVAHFNLGSTLFDQGQSAEAIYHHRQALIINPDHADAHNNLGTALTTQGQLAEAIDHFHRAVSIAPDHVGASYNLGKALSDQGRFAEAIDHFRRAVSIDPDFAGAHNNLGIALATLGQSAEATDHFFRAVSSDPDLAEARFNLGNALCVQGQFTEAIRHYRQATIINPNYASAHHNLGNALATQHQFAEAIDHYQKALSIDSRFWQVHLQLGALYLEQGMRETAIKHLRAAVQLQPDSEAAQELLRGALDQ